ncbi:hypothetical protein OEZ85_010239 [Tetradesmus obliquus]|uniref:Secreted protein n=1 Tax=Tetradesmus obliquus TaxID=3088 RepID=A0ABY8TLN8_TETOB|nr:hypothetical protein OEZ85_010239 [Tetradesmus obliquus]
MRHNAVQCAAHVWQRLVRVLALALCALTGGVKCVQTPDTRQRSRVAAELLWSTVAQLRLAQGIQAGCC